MASNQDHLLNNEDFEKLDPLHDADQVENITSTSLSGDMAEADRYHANDPNDLLAEFGGGSDEFNLGHAVSTSNNEPLMSFGSAHPNPIPETEVKEVEQGGPSDGCVFKNVDPRVLELIYWRDVKKTGVVFGSMLFVLVSLACCTLLSVLAYLSLAVLTVTFSFRVYKNVMQAVQKTNDGHPFKKLLDTDIELKEEVIRNAAENIAKHVNSCHYELRRLYLVVDYIDSIKFGMLLWLLTYIGSWFNGITLVMLAVVSIFTLPKVYETYKVPIDSQVNMVRGHLNKAMAQITAKIPFPKKKPKTQ